MKDSTGAGRELHNRLTQLFSVAMLVIGFALAVRLTLVSVILGVLFIAAGSGRLYAQLRRRR